MIRLILSKSVAGVVVQNLHIAKARDEQEQDYTEETASPTEEEPHLISVVVFASIRSDRVWLIIIEIHVRTYVRIYT